MEIPYTFPEILDATQLVAFRNCKQKFYREYIQSLRKSETSIHLHFGGAFARGMEVARAYYYTKEPDIRRAVEEAAKEVIVYWGDYEIPPSVSSRNAKDLNSCIAALEDYFRVYPPETDHIVPARRNDGTPAIEFSFGVPLPVKHPTTGNPLVYAGRFDMLGRERDRDLLCIVDEKTTSQMGPTWPSQWNMRSQLIGYCWGAQCHGYPTNHALVRGVAILKTQVKHCEAPLTYPDWQINRWYNQMLDTVREMVICFKNNAWPLDYGNACDAYGGCPMQQLCTTEHPERWYSDFVVQPWHPLAKDFTREEKKDD